MTKSWKMFFSVSALFALWNISFACLWANLAVLEMIENMNFYKSSTRLYEVFQDFFKQNKVSGRWMVNNMRKSMSLTIGTSYWKGLFVQCKMTSMTEFDCDNFEVPWFTFDGLILSCRAMLVLAVITIVTSGNYLS